ncbi:pimeloyl-ACP methyl ester carboxylesterase [Humitalea rosea]|uniref:Pimeloyl-ACP methyl ester carboxylesterase n=1 Tax=Humitalea rosea TaxID=990373 RepID=A0A2W7IT59_9PROT|nr:alpha/beta hydrolase [Humitalea rosea]PZW49053.1 pimeloyl-ACP methyl ester carboxylesterase [Humitalea rosea]
MTEELGRLREIAYARLPGTKPGVVFLGGFHSDMQGNKATFLRGHCAAHDRAYLRLDYSGHGESGGRFEEGSIGLWLADAESALLELTDGPQILVGSSMGGWIAMLLARRHPTKVAAVLGIAAAPDFLTMLLEPALPAKARAELAAKGVVLMPSEYGEPTPITRHLVEESKEHLLLDPGFDLPCPLHLVQGMADPDVPWHHALRIVEACRRQDTRLTLIRDGDHRLSRPQDLELICQLLGALLSTAASPSR